MNPVFEQIHEIGIVPVIALEDAKDARGLAEALLRGGITCAEVTFRTAAAADTIRVIAKEYPQMLVGAGTVLTTDQADEAVEAGASFLVSPGMNPVTVEHCLKREIPILPGVMTPSEIELALSLGITTVKFFPAEAAGGIQMIKAMSAPYGQVRFMPTGGISLANMGEYLSFPKVIACGGSWMVKKELIQNGQFDRITELSMEAMKKKEEIRACQKS